jgi:hypothetical protein
MTHRATVLVTLALVSQAGCYLSHEVPRDLDPPEPEVAAEPPDALGQLCRDLASTACLAFQNCCMGVRSFDLAYCVENFVDDCDTRLFDDHVRARIESGALRFDPAAAQAWIDRIRERAGSCEVSVTWEMPGTARDLFTLRGLLVGTRRDGEPCNSEEELSYGYPSDCELGVCHVVGAEVGEAGRLVVTEGRCVAVAPLGGSCAGGRVCVDLDAPIAVEPLAFLDYSPTSAFHPFLQYQAPLACVDDVCVPRLEDGAACDGAAQCESWICDEGTCEAPAPLGAPCRYSADCAQPSFCPYTADRSSTCQPGSELPLGAPCRYATQCESRACVDVCVPPICMEALGMWYP